MLDRHLHSRRLGAALIFFLAPAAQADDYSRLKGFWQCQEQGVPYQLEFQSPSKLLYKGEATTYELRDNVLVVQEEYGPVGYFYQLQGETLTFLTPYGGVSAQCQRAKKPVIAAPSPQKQAPAPSGKHPAQAVVPGRNWPVYARPAGRVTMESTDPQALVYKFSGRWDHATTNTLSNLYLKPDGSYEEAYEAGYSGTFEDQGGYQTGNWGATGSEQGGGYWTIQGDLKKGVITLVGNNGSRREINYQVYMKNGEYYGDYYFNGKLHTVKYIYR